MKTSDLSEFDLYLFHQGTNYHAYEMLGAHFVVTGCLGMVIEKLAYKPPLGFSLRHCDRRSIKDCMK